jgi:capsular polysaccharide biosynthesis protein
VKVQDYVNILRRRGWIVILTVLVTASSAFVYSKLQTPVYRSSVQVGIQAARPDWGAAQTVQILLDSYVSFMYTRPEAQKVIDELGLMRTPEELKGDVTIASDRQDLTIQIDVDDPDGEQANRIARTWAEHLVRWRDSENQRQMKPDRVFATILEEPTYHQIRPKTKINTAAGGIFGLLIGTLVVMVIEWLDAGLVRTPGEVEQSANLSVVGVIPATK